MTDSDSVVGWTPEAEHALSGLITRWGLSDGTGVLLRQGAEARARSQAEASGSVALVQPMDVESAWREYWPQGVAWPGEGTPSELAAAAAAAGEDAGHTPVTLEVPEVPEVLRTITIPSDDGRGNIGETVALDRAGEARLPTSRYAELKLLESIAWSADIIARKLGALVDAQRNR
jgi:hypothetical protein